MKINELLVSIRKKHNLSQTEMAQKLNISEPMYKFLEYGEPL
jgi:transcriptional regulator with XRE-family HTH domain